MISSIKKLPWIRLLRPHQWIKNLAVFFPLIIRQKGTLVPDLFLAALAFVIFSGAASSVYIFNDLIDAARDRDHSIKSMRPLVTGEVSSVSALLLLVVLLTTVLAASWEFSLLIPIALYLAGNILYSLIGKKLFLVDIAMISLFFLLRVELGSILFKIQLPVLLAFTILIYFLGMASLKRYVEITAAETLHRPYQKKHRSLMAAISIACTGISLTLFAFFLSSPPIRLTYSHLHWLLLLPLLAAIGNARLFSKARKNQLPEDFSSFLIKDTFSIVLLICSALVVAGAR